MTSTFNVRRLTGLAMLAMLALLIVANAFPAPDLSASNIGAFLQEHRDGMRWGGYLGALATVPLLLFANGLRILLANAGFSGLGAMALTGGAVSAGVLLVASAIQQVVVVYPTGDPEVAAVLGRLGPSELSAAVIGFPFALMMASVAIGAIRSGLLPRWFGWLALLLALLKALDPLHLALTSPKSRNSGLRLNHLVAVVDRRPASRYARLIRQLASRRLKFGMAG